VAMAAAAPAVGTDPKSFREVLKATPPCESQEGKCCPIPVLGSPWELGGTADLYRPEFTF
jgi:hypothetical protein